MTDTELLDFYIKQSGLKRGKIASTLGITMAALKKKTDGDREFKASEIKVLCSVLGIRDRNVIDRIFFASNGELNSTN